MSNAPAKSGGHSVVRATGPPSEPTKRMATMSFTTTFTSTCTSSEIARGLPDRPEDVARPPPGKASDVSRHEQRWGRRGSLSVRRTGQKRWLWYDHERGEGGDLLQLIRRKRDVGLGKAINIAVTEFLDGEIKNR